MTTPSGDPRLEVAPKMAELSANVLFGDVWERPGLSKRDRSLITVATLVALYPHRAVAGAHRAGPGQRRNQGRDRRSHHPHGFLRRLAHRGQRGEGGERGL